MSTTYVTHDELLQFGRKLTEHHITIDDLSCFEQKLVKQVVSPHELEEFRKHLIAEFKNLIAKAHQNPQGKILKTSEVMVKLKISHNTLISYRKSGILPFNKIGKIIYYKNEDVLKLSDSLEVQRAKSVDEKFRRFMRKIKRESKN